MWKLVLPARGDPYTMAPVPADAALPAAAQTTAASADKLWIDRLKRANSVPTYGDICRLLDLTAAQSLGIY
jgi:hypothetical protein